jgi:hypothetical protein
VRRSRAPSAGVGGRRALATLLIGLGTFAVYVGISPTSARSWDGQVMYAVTRNLVDHRSLTVPKPVAYEGRVIIPAGERIIAGKYSHYGIGVSLLLLVPYALQRAVGMHGGGLVLLANPAVLALSTAVVYSIGRALKLRAVPALLGALAFGLLSMAPAYSMELFSEPLVALATALVVLGLLWWRDDRVPAGPLVTGAALSIGILARPDALLLIGGGLVLLPAFVPARRLRAQPRGLLFAAAPILVALAWTVWYAHLRDGTWWPAPYGGGRFDVPIGTGLHGLLYSPGKGFFWYNPFLLVGVAGLAVLWARDRAVAAVLTFFVVARVLLYARWNFWAGDAAWGPRFLFPACVPLAVATAVALDRVPALRTLPGRMVAGALALVGSFVSFVSVAAPYWLWWDIISQPMRAVPPDQRTAVVAQQISDSYWTWRLSGLHGSIRLLGDVPSQLAHVAGGPDVVVVAALAVAAACYLRAATLARRDQALALPNYTGSRQLDSMASNSARDRELPSERKTAVHRRSGVGTRTRRPS